jgi:hypothetical protein
VKGYLEPVTPFFEVVGISTGLRLVLENDNVIALRLEMSGGGEAPKTCSDHHDVG